LERAAAESGTHVDFSCTPHESEKSRIHLRRQGQIHGFLQAAAEMNRRGWVIRIEDGYRDRIGQKFGGRNPAPRFNRRERREGAANAKKT